MRRLWKPVGTPPEGKVWKMSLVGSNPTLAAINIALIEENKPYAHNLMCLKTGYSI